MHIKVSDLHIVLQDLGICGSKLKLNFCNSDLHLPICFRFCAHILAGIYKLRWSTKAIIEYKYSKRLMFYTKVTFLVVLLRTLSRFVIKTYNQLH